MTTHLGPLVLRGADAGSLLLPNPLDRLSNSAHAGSVLSRGPELHTIESGLWQLCLMYRWFRNNLSLRGIAAIAIGVLFQWMVFTPGVIDPPMPWPLAALFSLMGLALALAGCMAIWFKWRRERVAESTRPEKVLVELKDGGGEGSADIAVVQASSGRWEVPFHGPSAAGKLFGKGKLEATAWLDPTTNMPVVLDVGGVRLNTLWKPSRT